jgi:hypothetical protein
MPTVAHFACPSISVPVNQKQFPQEDNIVINYRDRAMAQAVSLLKPRFDTRPIHVGFMVE